MFEPDWQSAEMRLYDACRDALASFSRENGSDVVSFFAFDTEPSAGQVILAFDTRENEVVQAKQTHDDAIAVQRLKGEAPGGFHTAKYYATRTPLTLHSSNTGDFAHAQYRSVAFPDWAECARADDYPEPEPGQGDYLEGHVIVMFRRVFDRLLRDDAFALLLRAVPFRLGFNFHDGELVVMHLVGLG